MNRDDHNNLSGVEATKREAEAAERKVFREEHEQTFPRTLYEWKSPAGQGYFCRIVESEPGIVHFEQAPRQPLDPTKPLDLFWMRTDKPMGCANEMVQLHTALLRAEMENVASETCSGGEKHCSCVGLLRREVRELSAAKSLNARIAADAIADRELDQKQHRIEMKNERNRFAAHLSEADARAEKAEQRNIEQEQAHGHAMSAIEIWRGRAEQAECELAEAREAIRSICEAHVILLDCDDECCKPFVDLPAVRAALEAR